MMLNTIGGKPRKPDDTTKEVIQIRAELLKSIDQLNIASAKSKDNHPIQTFFLLYGLQSILAAVFRVLFYAFLAFPILGTLGIITSASYSKNVGIFEVIAEIIFGSVIYILPALFFRWLAVMADRRSRHNGANKPI